MVGKVAQSQRDSRYPLITISSVFLDKPSHQGVPVRRLAIRIPMPFGQSRQQDPSRFSQGSGKMGSCRIDGGHQIQILDEGSCIVKIVEILCWLGDAKLLTFAFARTFLQEMPENPGIPPVVVPMSGDGTRKISCRQEISLKEDKRTSALMAPYSRPRLWLTTPRLYQAFA